MNVKSACLFAANLIGIPFAWCWWNHNINTEIEIALPYQGFCPGQKDSINIFELNLGRLVLKSIPIYLLMVFSFVCGFEGYRLLKE